VIATLEGQRAIEVSLRLLDLPSIHPRVDCFHRRTMMTFARKRRTSLILTATAGALAMLAAATPAWARQSGGVHAQLDDLVIGASGAPGKALPMYVGAWDVTNPKVTIDVSA
jgi:hypothetical protein